MITITNECTEAYYSRAVSLQAEQGHDEGAVCRWGIRTCPWFNH